MPITIMIIPTSLFNFSKNLGVINFCSLLAPNIFKRSIMKKVININVKYQNNLFPDTSTSSEPTAITVNQKNITPGLNPFKNNPFKNK